MVRDRAQRGHVRQRERRIRRPGGLPQEAEDSIDAFYRAHRLAEVGRYAEAERAVREGLASEPGSGRLLTALAWVLRLRREYPGALSTADAAIAADPGYADAHAERAEILLSLLRASDAVTSAREAARLEPLRPAGHLVLARALSSAHQREEARAAAAHGLALDPASVEGLLTVAEVEREAGNRESAAAAARAVLAIDPANAYGRWLIAMLDAERLQVRRSMRALRDVARDNPARPDVLAMTWPIRGVLSGLRRGVPLGALIVCLLVLASLRWSLVGDFARLLSLVVASVLVGFGLRVLIPAGRLPWRCLRLVPRLTRRAAVAGLVTAGVAVTLLIAYAVSTWTLLPLIAFLLSGPMWIFGLAELLGAGLDDPGYRHALLDLAGDFRRWWREFRSIWRSDR
jgi:tetratricopeptide (TPR) repeat protein